jgi:tetratricopeptide (TPR) repeat protein
MPGIGKSELALQYAILQREQELFKGGIAYLSAANFLDDLLDFLVAAELNGTTDFRSLRSPKAQAKKAWELWQEFCAPLSVQALVVIDDVTDYQEQIADFLPQITQGNSPFRFLLTSRERWDLAFFELEELELDAAVEVFCHYVGTKHQDRLDGQMATVENLCERLGKLPLALALAGSWLGAASGRTMTALVKALEAEGLDSLPLAPDKQKTLATHRRQQGLKAAFQVSWQQLKEFDGAAQQLARVLSLFLPGNVDWVLVEQVAACYPVALPPSAPPRRSLWQRFWDWLRGWFGYRPPVKKQPERLTAKILDLIAARDWLCGTSLLREVSKDEVYRVHGLLHEFFGGQWRAQTDRRGWQMAFVAGLSERAAAIPANAGWEQVTEWQSLRPYFRQSMAVADELLQTIGNAELGKRLREQRLESQAGEFRLNLVPNFANTFQQAKDAYNRAKAARERDQQAEANRYFNDALAGYQRAIEQGRQALPKDSLTLAGYLNEIGQFYKERGHYSDGILPAEEALKIARLKASKKTIALYANNLAVLYNNQGKYEAAEPLYIEALEMRKELLGDRHPHVATSLVNLGTLYKSQGQYEAAEPLYLEALQMRKELLGDRHPDVALSLNNLAVLYDSQGKYEAAEPLYIEALQMRKELLGDRHPDVALSLNNLAVLYDSQGKYEAAEPLYIEALQMRKELLGDRHPDVAQSLNNLALLYYNQGKYEAAEPLYLEALQMQKELLGDRHPDVALSLNNLAVLYDSQRKYEAAEPLYLEALQMRKELLGDRHPDVALSLNNLAVLYYHQSRFDEAEPLLLQALEIRESALGSEHPNTLGTKRSLANLRTNRQP